MTPLEYHPLIRNKKDNTFTIGYYKAEGTFKDRYGMDVVEYLIDYYSTKDRRVTWKELRPNQYSEQDMIKNFYSKINLYLRPSRWDGDPFIVREALHFNIPTISTFSTIKKNIKCNPEDLRDLIYKINLLKSKYFNENEINK